MSAETTRSIERVRALLAAARAVAADAEVREATAESTGLSRAGVDLAMTRHLEVDASDDDLAKLVAYAGAAEAVTVILSSNVFVGALRALALAVAATDDVVVRPSRRDPAFASARANAAAIPLVEELDVATITRGEIHVYGRDETIADVRSRALVPVKGHGSGMGVALVTASADVDASARALADDVVVFDQRGCLSPRLVLAADRIADDFADALHAALEDSPIPRGLLSSEERAASSRYLSTMSYGGRILVGNQHAVGVAKTIISCPAYRHVHVVATDDPAEILTAIARGVTTIGSNDLEAARAIAPAHARLARLGEMQRPPLDGPVDLRDPLTSGLAASPGPRLSNWPPRK
jgi:acyl-CoA reductase-like NAD-dependent aldehyde dehydrogenase